MYVQYYQRPVKMFCSTQLLYCNIEQHLKIKHNREIMRYSVEISLVA